MITVGEYSELFDEVARKNNDIELAERMFQHHTDMEIRQRIQQGIANDKQILSELYEQINTAELNPYDVLNIPADAKGSQIFAAYQGRLKEIRSKYSSWARKIEGQRNSNDLGRWQYHLAVARTEYNRRLLQIIEESYQKLASPTRAHRLLRRKPRWSFLKFWR